MRAILSLPAICFLAACGGSDDPFVTRATDAVALGREITDLAPTSNARVPDTGSSEFTGYGFIFIDPVLEEDDDDRTALGDLSLTVTFANGGSVTGTVDNFEGTAGFGLTERVVPASGSIEIGGNSSGIGRNGPRNTFDADYAGTVTIDGEPFEVDGTLDGDFYGNRTSATNSDDYIKGVIANDLDGFSLDSDGDDAPVQFDVWGVNPG